MMASSVDILGNGSTTIGLSYRPNVTVVTGERVSGDVLVNRVHVKRYFTGETVITCGPKPKPDINESRSKPPVNFGGRVSEGLSKHGRKRIRLASNYYHARFGRANMITLTYGDVSQSDDMTSKKDLDRFLKSMKRYVERHCRNDGFHFIWVAQIQEKRLKRTGKRVIHYHVMLPHFIDKEVINRFWNNAVNRPRENRGEPTQTLYPNVINCYHAGAYMARYISNEGHQIRGNGYNMSQDTSEAIKPTFENCFDVDQSTTDELFYLFDKIGEHDPSVKVFDFVVETDDRIKGKWISNTNDFVFYEVIKNVLPDSLKSINQLPNFET